MLNFFEQLILIVFTAVISSLIAYLFTKNQYQKDSLRQYKMDACKDLIGNLIDFLQEAYPRNSLEKIFDAYCKFQASFYKSYAFLPKSLSSKIQSLDIITSNKLKTLDITTQCLKEFNRIDKSQHTKELLLRNPNINAMLLDVLSPLTKEIPNILKEIEKEFGITSSKTNKEKMPSN